jgi:hypothetical protein
MYKHFPNKGFSLIEVIGAVTILLMGLVGVLSLVIQNSRVIHHNELRLVGVMLAQEGVELTRNQRDSNWLSGAVWNSGICAAACDPTFTVEMTTGGALNFNYTPNVIGDSGTTLRVSTNGLYQHSGGISTTIFRRLITTSNPVGCNSTSCLRVVSQVQWDLRGRTYTQQVEEYLYDWQ